MNTSKLFVSSVVAASVVGTIALVYAQTGNTDQAPAAADTQSQTPSTPPTDAAMGSAPDPTPAALLPQTESQSTTEPGKDTMPSTGSTSTSPSYSSPSTNSSTSSTDSTGAAKSDSGGGMSGTAPDSKEPMAKADRN